MGDAFLFDSIMPKHMQEGVISNSHAAMQDGATRETVQQKIVWAYPVTYYVKLTLDDIEQCRYVCFRDAATGKEYPNVSKWSIDNANTIHSMDVLAVQAIRHLAPLDYDLVIAHGQIHRS